MEAVKKEDSSHALGRLHRGNLIYQSFCLKFQCRSAHRIANAAFITWVPIDFSREAGLKQLSGRRCSFEIIVDWQASEASEYYYVAIIGSLAQVSRHLPVVAGS